MLYLQFEFILHHSFYHLLLSHMQILRAFTLSDQFPLQQSMEPRYTSVRPFKPGSYLESSALLLDFILKGLLPAVSEPLTENSFLQAGSEVNILPGVTSCSAPLAAHPPDSLSAVRGLRIFLSHRCFYCFRLFVRISRCHSK